MQPVDLVIIVVYLAAVIAAGAWFGKQAIYGSGDYVREHVLGKCVVVCVAILSLSLLTAFIFSRRKAARSGHKLFDHTARRLVISLFVPLLAGGVFCISLLLREGWEQLTAAVMLLFYGLALVNASKYTVHDIRTLGYFEIVLGLFAGFFPGYGLLFWALGFGGLHIIYGAVMWFKYDRVSSNAAKARP